MCSKERLLWHFPFYSKRRKKFSVRVKWNLLSAFFILTLYSSIISLSLSYCWFFFFSLSCFIFLSCFVFLFLSISIHPSFFSSLSIYLLFPSLLLSPSIFLLFFYHVHRHSIQVQPLLIFRCIWKNAFSENANCITII